MKFLILLCVITSALSKNGIGPISEDFERFLDRRGMEQYDFSRNDLNDFGSFGGKQVPFEAIEKTPIFFIHGNSDAALKANDFSTGFSNVIKHFLQNGYHMSELYATSWGDTNTTAAVYRDHDCYTVMRLRLFLEAVLAYTGKSKVHMITHSMGVTLGRKIIQGGYIDAHDGACNLGPSLVHKVDIFVGMSGANWGLCACVGATEHLPTCNKKNGLFPGSVCGSNDASVCGRSPLPTDCVANQYSDLLVELNHPHRKDGSEVYSVWSTDDELIMFGNYVWGRSTSLIPNSSGYKIYKGLSHMQTKEDTAEDLFVMINERRIP